MISDVLFRIGVSQREVNLKVAGNGSDGTCVEFNELDLRNVVAFSYLEVRLFSFRCVLTSEK